MDELEAVHRLLAQPPPSREVVEAARASLGWAGVAAPRHEDPVVHLNGGRHMFVPQPPPRRRRWRGWLAPVAAAVAVTAAVAGSLVISKAIGHRAGPGAASGSAVTAVARAGVPRYFVALPGSIQGSGAPRAVVGATATGKVLGTVAVPEPYGVFTWVAAAANDRDFVLAAEPSHEPPGTEQARFYRLVLSRSGRPGPLVPLRVAPQSGIIKGVALSPRGTRLAVSLLPNSGTTPRSEIRVFGLVHGDVYAYWWPSIPLIGWTKPVARSLSWEADNRTLMFEADVASAHARAFLLHTASGGLTRIPIPRQELSATSEDGPHVSGPPLITGDGTKVVAPTTAHLAPETSDIAITEFSVKTGKPVLVLDRQATQDQGWTDIQWASTSGTSLIAVVPGPPSGAEHIAQPVIGVQDGATFTPLPAAVQHAFNAGQLAW